MIVNFRGRAEVILWRAMALQAPLHVKRLGAPGDRHFVDLAMAGGTTDAFRNMDAVVEISEIGEVIHPLLQIVESEARGGEFLVKHLARKWHLELGGISARDCGAMMIDPENASADNAQQEEPQCHVLRAFTGDAFPFAEPARQPLRPSKRYEPPRTKTARRLRSGR